MRRDPVVKHPARVPEGSRRHVIWWASDGRHCNEPRCEINAEPVVGAAERPDWMDDEEWETFRDWEQSVADLYGVRIKAKAVIQ